MQKSLDQREFELLQYIRKYQPQENMTLQKSEIDQFKIKNKIIQEVQNSGFGEFQLQKTTKPPTQLSYYFSAENYKIIPKNQINSDQLQQILLYWLSLNNACSKKISYIVKQNWSKIQNSVRGISENIEDKIANKIADFFKKVYAK